METRLSSSNKWKRILTRSIATNRIRAKRFESFPTLKAFNISATSRKKGIFSGLLMPAAAKRPSPASISSSIPTARTPISGLSSCLSSAFLAPNAAARGSKTACKSVVFADEVAALRPAVIKAAPGVSVPADQAATGTLGTADT